MVMHCFEHHTETLVIPGGKLILICKKNTWKLGSLVCKQTRKNLQVLEPYLLLHMFEHMAI